MNILAFDTCLGACSAALATPNGVTGAFELRERQHAEHLIGMIEGVLREGGSDWAEVDAIAVTCGPGSFTGVRVGVSAARGFALALSKPVVTATTLDVMAHEVVQENGTMDAKFAVTVDARRGEVYVACYGPDGAPLCVAQACAPQKAASLMQQHGITHAFGSGAKLVSEAASSGNAIDVGLEHLQPDARALAEMAKDLPPLEAPLRPLYLRAPDAKPQDGKAIARKA